MSLFEWKPIYATGIDNVDRQHLKLVGYMNQFHESQAGGKPQEAIGSLQSLVRYTKIHFADEEAMMKQNKYPDYEAHHAVHVQLLGIVEKLAKAYASDPGPKNAENLGNYLKTWLANHILGTDKKYVPFMHVH